jgi:prepilin-type N-terminal cleavage/methylation domain-containing protein
MAVVQRGFTLAEAMLATVILGIAAAGVLLPFTAGASVRAEGTHRTLAAKLASDLMEKIVNKPFDDIVSNYNGYSEPQGQVKDAAGTVFTGSNYANFSRDVSCAYVYVPQENGTAEPKFIRVTVRVYYRGKQIASINRLVGK